MRVLVRRSFSHDMRVLLTVLVRSCSHEMKVLEKRRCSHEGIGKEEVFT